MVFGISQRSLYFTFGAALGILVTFIICIVVFKPTNENPVDLSQHSNTMVSCINNVLKVVPNDKMTMGYYERIWRLCGNQIFNGLYLDDFVIRRDKFIRQEFDERVNLWLVVAITFSGVVLAALQLFMAYNLTVSGKDAFPKDSELVLESGKLSLKSSVTGLAILALSLAFFIIYVKYIYSMNEVAVGRPANLGTPAETEIEAEPPQAPKTPEKERKPTEEPVPQP
jgi:ABC-type antimicrobial peptide transport system permease subunit